MKISKEARRFAREFFGVSLGPDGKLDAARVRQIADQLVAEKPRHYDQILREYTRLVRLELEKRHAIIGSASPLAPAEAEAIARDIHARFGADVTVEHRVDPALVGGLRVQVGSDVWDGSIRARLDALTKQI